MTKYPTQNKSDHEIHDRSSQEARHIHCDLEWSPSDSYCNPPFITDENFMSGY